MALTNPVAPLLVSPAFSRNIKKTFHTGAQERQPDHCWGIIPRAQRQYWFYSTWYLSSFLPSSTHIGCKSHASRSLQDLLHFSASTLPWGSLLLHRHQLLLLLIQTEIKTLSHLLYTALKIAFCFVLEDGLVYARLAYGFYLHMRASVISSTSCYRWREGYLAAAPVVWLH